MREREETVHTRFNSHELGVDGGVLNHGQADVFINATNYLQSLPPLNVPGITHQKLQRYGIVNDEMAERAEEVISWNEP